MAGNIFQDVKSALQPRLPEVLADLLPGGKVDGKEYVCASLEGGAGHSCKTNIETGKGSDFATGESWGDVIALAAVCLGKRQIEAARELAHRYGIAVDDGRQRYDTPREKTRPVQLAKQSAVAPAASGTCVVPPKTGYKPITPIPDDVALPNNFSHPKYGQVRTLWTYFDKQGRRLAYTARLETESGKVILPISCWQYAYGKPQFEWKALPEPRPLFGLDRLAKSPTLPVLLVEGEKTAMAASSLIDDHIAVTWCGGACAVGKADLEPLAGRRVVIWPDNDKPGFKAALDLADRLVNVANLAIVLPDESLPEKWDLADAIPFDLDVKRCILAAMRPDDFRQAAFDRFPILAPQVSANTMAVTGYNQATQEEETFDLKAWPNLSTDAYPGLLGEFVRLATRDSEADPAAVCATTLVRFCGEIYGHAANQGPYIMVGETRHQPRLFAVICGNTSKARKGTSRHPVTKLFDINGRPTNLAAMPAPAKISNGPLSSGEGLAFNVRELTDEEWEKLEKSPSMAGRNRDDKRLVILDEEFASALSCMKREGNTLSMSIRCFWDSGEYAPLTKSNPVTVKGAHINILSHITMQELAVALEEVQVVNGFGNRFLWICARRSKLVPLPSPMPDNELVRLQSAFWERVAFAQKQGRMTMTPDAIRLWQGAYPDLSKEHAGFVGNIVNRAEAQTLRLALVYALLDGSDKINPMHLHSALCMWHYAEASALYIFGDKPANPLETKILEFLKNGPLTATELSKALSGHVPSETLQPVLQQLEIQQRITIEKLKTGGRAKVVISLRSLTEASEKRENGEKSGVAA